MRTFVVLPLLALAIVVSVFFSQWRRSPAPSAVEADPAPSTTAEQLLELKREIASLKKKAGAPHLLVLRPEAKDTRGSRRDDDEDPAVTEEQSRETAAAFERHSAAERADPEYSQATARQLRQIFSDKDSGTMLTAVDCFSSHCRVAFQHDGQASQRLLGTRLEDFPMIEWGVFYRYDWTSVPPRTTAYFLRKGHDFASVVSGI